MNIPLHPAIVHLPIGLAVLLPLLSLLAAVAIARGAPVRPVWGVAALLFLVLLVGGLVAKDTGGDQEETVEQVVPHGALEAHEEAADRAVLAMWVGLALAVLGLAGGRPGSIARTLAVVASFALAGLVLLTGKLGGELVYVHGAAAAYVDEGVVGSPLAPSPALDGAGDSGEREDGDDD